LAERQQGLWFVLHGSSCVTTDALEVRGDRSNLPVPSKSA